MTRNVVSTLGRESFCRGGYTREIPFGCVGDGLLSILYFLPGQAMATHRHLDSDEYFTAVSGDAEMFIDGQVVPLHEGYTYLRLRGTHHAIRNRGPAPLVVQSFQVPLPGDSATVWEPVDGWACDEWACRRCWCGQREMGLCANCGAPLPEPR